MASRRWDHAPRHSPRLPCRGGRGQCLRHPAVFGSPPRVSTLNPGRQPNIDVHGDAHNASTKHSRKLAEKIRNLVSGPERCGGEGGRPSVVSTLIGRSLPSDTTRRSRRALNHT